MEDLAGLLSRHTQADSRLVVKPGIGRDAAVISFGDRYLIAKTDPITFATAEIGWYAVQVNANDIAAMGGTPRWFLAALLLPEGKTNPQMVETIFEQISRACRDLGITLCGGHTEITLGLDRPIVVGQMLGEAEPGQLASPERILPGDEILLTKGIAIEGTALIAREKKELGNSFAKEWLRKCQDLSEEPRNQRCPGRPDRHARAAGFMPCTTPPKAAWRPAFTNWPRRPMSACGWKGTKYPFSPKPKFSARNWDWIL